MPTEPTRARWDARLRQQLATALRSRVAGDDAAAKAAVIWGAEGERWFTPEDPIWRVHADAAMFPGGIRALLLQSLHPLAMAGVAGHSGFKGDPWGRLQRTSEFLATTTFGTIQHAETQIERVRAIHERVRGKAADGRPYAASDPHLLRWVHVTEVDSFLTAFQRYAAEPLTPAEADLYVEQTAVVARRLGVVDPPLTTAQLASVIESYRPELESTAASRDAARFLLLHPPLPVAAKPGYAALAAGAVALLPRWARRPLRLPWLPVTELVFARPLGDAATAAVRWAMTDPNDVRAAAERSRAG
ncbi:oxygenase MpaB family protein [Knoellia sp. CPCC 206450]|uniref:oxygenase MpaB family protein n=1 Tax=Knoellia tibetensis TaxID=3404798 RepID=UPI003B4292EC